MNAFDYSGPSKISKELAYSHRISKNASKSVDEARTIKGTDPGTIYGISRSGDESVNRFNAVRARESARTKLQVKLQSNDTHGEHRGDKETQARRAANT
jgi:hypothetical protein